MNELRPSGSRNSDQQQSESKGPIEARGSIEGSPIRAARPQLDLLAEPSGERDVPCQPEACADTCAPTPRIPEKMREVKITQLNYGFLVKIDCHTFAFEKAETFLKVLAEYMKDPQGTEKKWYSGNLL